MIAKKTILSFLVITVVSTAMVSCDDDGDDCKAGSGGEVTLILKPQHHGDPIYNQPGYPDSAFIAYNETEFPGDDPSKYNIVAAGTVGTDYVTIGGLKCGKYYVFMTGFDTSIVQRVKGGIPIEITEKSGTVTLLLPVVED
jgi:hypothetical protein